MLDLQPTLTGTSIKLRPLTAEDFQELFAAAADPLVWAQHPDPGRATREGFSSVFDVALKSKGCLARRSARRIRGGTPAGADTCHIPLNATIVDGGCCAGIWAGIDTMIIMCSVRHALRPNH